MYFVIMIWLLCIINFLVINYNVVTHKLFTSNFNVYITAMLGNDHYLKISFNTRIYSFFNLL